MNIPTRVPLYNTTSSINARNGQVYARSTHEQEDMNTMKKICTAMFLLYLLQFLTGCEKTAIEKTLLFPAGEYLQVDYLSASAPVTFTRAEDNILVLQPGESAPILSVELKKLPKDLKCMNGIAYALHGLLPDGRMLFVESCEPSTHAAYEQDSFLIAYDPISQKTEKLIIEPLIHKWSGYFTWNPDRTVGLYQVGGSLVGADIFWMTPEKTLPMNIEVGDGKYSWILSKDYPQFSTEPGVAAYPAWSPDGETIAFFASTDAKGKGGPVRSDSEFRLYFMEPIEKKPETVLNGVYHPLNLVWSPASQWLAFIGEYGTLRRYGIWLFSKEDRKARLLDVGDFRDIAWSPAGDRILVAFCVQEVSCPQEEIWEYDVSALMK